MPLSALYYARVSDQSVYGEAFQDLETFESSNTQSFNVCFCVCFAFRSDSQLFFIDYPPAIHTLQSISCEQFFQEGPAFLRRNLSHPTIHPDSLEELIPSMMSDAQYFYDMHRRSSVGDCSSVTYPLNVDIIIELEETEEGLERVLWESMEDQETLMVPTSEEAIMSLNTMKVEDNIDADADRCCICLEEYDEGVKASTLPCHHIYHSDCIVQWLKTSHLCPLCRFEMPVQSNNDNDF